MADMRTMTVRIATLGDPSGIQTITTSLAQAETASRQTQEAMASGARRTKAELQSAAAEAEKLRRQQGAAAAALNQQAASRAAQGPTMSGSGSGTVQAELSAQIAAQEKAAAEAAARRRVDAQATAVAMERQRQAAALTALSGTYNPGTLSGSGAGAVSASASATSAAAAATQALNAEAAAARDAAAAAQQLAAAQAAERAAAVAATTAKQAQIAQSYAAMQAFRREAEQMRINQAISSNAMRQQAQMMAGEWMAMNSRVMFAAPAIQNVGRAAANASGGIKQAAMASNQAGLAAMQWAYFIDDVQYGLKGVVNNIPMLLMYSGINMKWAAAISMVAVAFKVATENMAVFNGGIPKSVQKAREAIVEARKVSDESDKIASNVATASENWKKHTASLEKTEEAYKKLRIQIDDTAESGRKLNRIILERTDAQAALDIANIEAREAEGNISESEAATQKRDVYEAVAKKKADIKQADIQIEIDSRTERAAARSKNILDKKKANDEFNEEFVGMMTNEERKAAEDLLATQVKKLEARKEQLKKTPKYIRKSTGEYNSSEFDNGEMVPNPEYKNIENQMVRPLAIDIKDRKGEIERDTQLRARAGEPFIKGGKNKLLEDSERLRAEIKEAAQEVLSEMQPVQILNKEKDEVAKNYSIEKETRRVKYGTEITKIQDQKMQDAEKERVAEEEKAKQTQQKKLSEAGDIVGDRWQQLILQRKLRARENDENDDELAPVFVGKKGKSGAKGKARQNAEQGQTKTVNELISEGTAAVNSVKDGIEGTELTDFKEAMINLAKAIRGKDDKMLSQVKWLYDTVMRDQSKMQKQRD